LYSVLRGRYCIDCSEKAQFAQNNQYKSMRLETTSRFKEAVSLYKKFGFMVLSGSGKTPGHDLVFEKAF
jgi:hypothetical protein